MYVGVVGYSVWLIDLLVIAPSERTKEAIPSIQGIIYPRQCHTTPAHLGLELGGDAEVGALAKLDHVLLSVFCACGLGMRDGGI